MVAACHLTHPFMYPKSSLEADGTAREADVGNRLLTLLFGNGIEGRALCVRRRRSHLLPVFQMWLAVSKEDEPADLKSANADTEGSLWCALLPPSRLPSPHYPC